MNNLTQEEMQLREFREEVTDLLALRSALRYLSRGETKKKKKEYLKQIKKVSKQIRQVDRTIKSLKKGRKYAKR